MRDEQRARNEALFRNLNERLKELDDRLDTRAVGAPSIDYEEFFCECGRLDCMARIAMTRADYESIRAHGERFAGARGPRGRRASMMSSSGIGASSWWRRLRGSLPKSARELDPRS